MTKQKTENAMTDYNDGKWHGWNGGECPVHSHSMIDAVSGGRPNLTTWYSLASAIPWRSIIAFRVIQAYREPREFWVNVYPAGTAANWRGSAYDSESAARADKSTRAETFRVREIID